MLNFTLKNSYTILIKLLYIILILYVLLNCVCGKKPSSPPAEKYGSLSITTIYQGNLTDSLTLSLDDQVMGNFKNPCLYNNVTAGRHKVSASYNRLYSGAEMVDVKRNETTDVTLELDEASPYEGSHAPNLEMTDIEGNLVNLENYHGRSILIIFMEYT